MRFGSRGLRLSLAGAQDKLPVRIVDGRVALPLGSTASTHIVKPAVRDFDGLVFNEAFCLALAAALGLPTTAFSVGRADDIDYLAVERFDRTVDGERVVSIHQEDFCQAMRLGGQRIADRVAPNDLRRLSKEAGLAPPLVVRRAAELLETTLARIDEIEKPHPVSERVAALVRDRVRTLLGRFGGRS